jgi:hypothetical protein
MIDRCFNVGSMHYEESVHVQIKGTNCLDMVAWSFSNLKLLELRRCFDVPRDMKHLGLVVDPCRTESVLSTLRALDVHEWIPMFRISVATEELLRSGCIPTYIITAVAQCGAVGIPRPSDAIPGVSPPPAPPKDLLDTHILAGQHLHYTPEVILRCFMFRCLLRNQADFKKAVVLAWRCSLMKVEADQLELALISGDLKLPSTTVLQKTEHRLCMLEFLWRRVRHDDTEFSSHLMPDSSPQGGYNYFLCIEFFWEWPRGLTVEEIVKHDLDSNCGQRYRALITMGHGCSDTLYKSAGMHHQLAIDTGTWKRFEHARMQSRTYTSDQGVEQDAARTSCLYEENFANTYAVK